MEQGSRDTSTKNKNSFYYFKEAYDRLPTSDNPKEAKANKAKLKLISYGTTSIVRLHIPRTFLAARSLWTMPSSSR